MSDPTDKVLIILLVMVLPLSVFISSKVQESSKSQLQETVKEQEIKLNQMVTTMQAAAPAQSTSAHPEITIDQVIYATDSGELKVTGTAPKRNINVFVSAIVSPVKAKTPSTSTASGSGTKVLEESDISVLGEAVEVLAVKTNDKGYFTFVKKIDRDKFDSIELHINQDESSTTIQYSISQNKRTL